MSTITAARLKNLPRRPGVYLMKDAKDKVVYIGKAKNLFNRVRSYFNHSDTRYNVEFLLEVVNTIETVVTADERQAIVLESDLIKKYKPRYNIRLKDDKAHLIVRIDMNHQWPRLELVRKQFDDGARYIGPFAFGYEVHVLLDVIRKMVPLRTCSNKVIINRVRPCLEYEIKHCSGPCCLAVNHEEYLAWVETAVQILEGKNDEVIIELERRMGQASAGLRYEDAAELRDRLGVLKRYKNEQLTVQFPQGARDAFGVCREGHQVEISVVSVRRGRLFDAKTFGFDDVEIPSDELLRSFVTQFYLAKNDIPDEILLPDDFEGRQALEGLLTERRVEGSGRPKTFVPRRGHRQRLLDLAVANAKENFKARFGLEDKRSETLRSLARELGLEQTPRLIECVDISHFQGSATVASLVAFQDGKPDKARYRHFHLSQEGKPDDFASMREVVTRHLSRAVEENDLPDLLVIDGGPAQLSQAMLARKSIDLSSPPMIGLAKKRVVSRRYLSGDENGVKPERVYLESQTNPVILDPHSDVQKLLERIRDEAHRFAITFHRQKRTRAAFTSALDSIPGVGANRRKALLKAFGGVQAIREADPAELVAKAQVPEALAKRIVELLNRGE